MPHLHDLPTETLHDITGKVAEHWKTFPTIAAVFPISTTCRRLNQICGYHIFRTYRLDIRNQGLYGWKAHKKLPMDVSSSHATWDADGVATRLAHMLEKAPYIRTLRIVDQVERNFPDGATQSGEPGALPEQIISELLAALNSLPALRELGIQVDTWTDIPVTIPDAIWKFIASRKITQLDLLGTLDVSDELEAIPHIKQIGLSYYAGSLQILKLVQPTLVHLKWPYPATHWPQYMPDSPKLQTITIDKFVLPPKLKGPLFDFAQVPQAAVHITIILTSEYKFQIPKEWQRIKRLLPGVFREGLDGYNVFYRHTQVVISRPSAVEAAETGWEPLYRDHLQGREEELEQEREMEAYYRAKQHMETQYHLARSLSNSEEEEYDETEGDEVQESAEGNAAVLSGDDNAERKGVDDTEIVG